MVGRVAKACAYGPQTHPSIMFARLVVVAAAAVRVCNCIDFQFIHSLLLFFFSVVACIICVYNWLTAFTCKQLLFICATAIQ